MPTLLTLDPRLYQIAFLSSFLMLGLLTRDWTLHPEIIATAIVTTLLTQGFFLWQTAPPGLTDPAEFTKPTKISIDSFYSPMITALGLSLLLRVEQPWVMALAAALAMSSKFLLRFNEKHIFNPGNFGIVCALCLTQGAWVSPGQWGESAWLVAIFLFCGGFVLKRVGRWDTTIAFLAFYLALEAMRNLYLGWTWDVWGHRMMNGSLVMFSLFMITDPRTIPNARVARILWAFSIALLTFWIRNTFFINTAVFWALFCLAPLTPLLDWLFKSDRFTWRFPDAEIPATAIPAVSHE